MRYRHQRGSGSGLAGRTERRPPLCPLSGQRPCAAFRNHGLQGERQKRQQSRSSPPSKEVSHPLDGFGEAEAGYYPYFPVVCDPTHN